MREPGEDDDELLNLTQEQQHRWGRWRAAEPPPPDCVTARNPVHCAWVAARLRALLGVDSPATMGTPAYEAWLAEHLVRIRMEPPPRAVAAHPEALAAWTERQNPSWRGPATQRSFDGAWMRGEEHVEAGPGMAPRRRRR